MLLRLVRGGKQLDLAAPCGLVKDETVHVMGRRRGGGGGSSELLDDCTRG